MLAIALYQPDIPQNFGSLLRLSACMGTECHVIEPCGFILEDKRIARVAMDYRDHVAWQRHISWEKFTGAVAGRRIILLSTKARLDYCSFTFYPDDILLVGRESAGVPDTVADYADAVVKIVMRPEARSMNVALAASMVLGEAVRQGKAASDIDIKQYNNF